MRLIDVAPCALRTPRLGVVLCSLLSGMAHAQLPPGFTLATPPALSHESNPNSWPQPDYLSEALKLTAFKPAPRVAALAPNLSTAASAARFIAMPVQTQAFGFSPAFRAIVGAHLDRELEREGLAATRQTDIHDAYGPLVRRLDDAQIAEVIKDHPRQKLVIVYLGHDGTNQAFVTLSVRDGQAHTQAHKTLPLPDDASAAEAAISRLLPELLKSAGVLSVPAPTPAPAARCSEGAWSFAAAPTTMAPDQRACRAIVMGTLLPYYELRRTSTADESVSPAKLAWLAQAYVYAEQEAVASDSLKAIRDLAAHQLGVPRIAATNDLLQYRQSGDPVVSRLARLLTAATVAKNSPSNSARDSQRREIDQTAEGLPAFTAALLRSRSQLRDFAARIDFCEIENAYPASLMRPVCPRGAAQQTPGGTRTASANEALLYQEWRLSWYHTDLRFLGFTQADQAGAEALVRNMPADVAQHPYLQRERYELIDQKNAGGNFDEQLVRKRESARRVVQSTADLQRYDSWLAGQSLSDHTWTNNLNISNDAQVRAIADADLRLVEVLGFDRFNRTGMPGNPSRTRKAGDGAYFLVQPASQIRMLWAMSTAPKSSASAPPRRVESQVYKARPFPPRQEVGGIAPIAEMEAELVRSPMDMYSRVSLAVARLKEGGSVDDARRLIDARPKDERVDRRIGESHEWALPAALFFGAGEPAVARGYYERVLAIGTGSESDLTSRVRLPMIAGHLRSALDAAAARLRRYESDTAQRDLVGLLFMLNKPEEAWATFLPRAASNETFQPWLAAYTGHRMAGATLPAIDRWLTQHGVDGAQIVRTEVADLYLHMNAVVDRVPTDADISFLQQPRGKRSYVNRVWAASALMVRSAMEDAHQKEAHAEASAALAAQVGAPFEMFALPDYTWVAWQATDGKDEVLADVRTATMRSSFDKLIAKSMLLALEGQTAESLKYMTAARYEIPSQVGALMSSRPIPAPYQFALSGYLMYRRTHDEGYRLQTLRFVRAYQTVQPFLGWPYSMEALLSEKPQERFTAACRAQFLDPQSHFLKLASVGGLNRSACAGSLWQ